VYLDSHWGEDLPLLEELAIIFEAADHPVVMIDDFRVPDDAGYRFDDHGEKKTVSLEYLSWEPSSNAVIFFPAARSNHETGACRGCAIVSKRTSPVAASLASLTTLRPWFGLEQRLPVGARNDV
jgi:hypothetical protein